MERVRWLGIGRADQETVSPDVKPQAIGHCIIPHGPEPSASDCAFLEDQDRRNRAHQEAEKQKIEALDNSAAPFLKAIERAQAYVTEHYPKWKLSASRNYGQDGWVNRFNVTLFHSDPSRDNDPDKGGRVEVRSPKSRWGIWELTDGYDTLTEEEHYQRLIAKLSEIWYLIDRAERMSKESH